MKFVCNNVAYVCVVIIIFDLVLFLIHKCMGFFYGHFSKTIFSITKQTNKREKNVLSFGVFWVSFLVITCKRLKLPVLKSFVYFKPVHRYNYTVFALPASHFFNCLQKQFTIQSSCPTL